jgi:hypothetical protein
MVWVYFHASKLSYTFSSAIGGGVETEAV